MLSSAHERSGTSRRGFLYIHAFVDLGRKGKKCSNSLGNTAMVSVGGLGLD